MKYIVEIPDEVKVSDELVPFDKCRPSWWDEAYQRGLNDAWVAAYKIYSVFTYGEVEKIFGSDVCTIDRIYEKYSPLEVVTIIREYERKTKPEEQIKVGDEVESAGDLYIVVRIRDNGTFEGICSAGVDMGLDLNKFTKTGRHFSQITDVLEQLQI